MQYKVKARSRKEIVSIAKKVRKMLDLDNVEYFPVEKVLDMLSEKIDTFNYEIVPDGELPDDIHADTNIHNGTIRIKESIYNRACNGEGRDRMTISHELGHYFLHYLIDEGRYEESLNYNNLPEYLDPEWQADCFAGALLMPKEIVEKYSIDETVIVCGVSYNAARCQKEKYKYA